jgi:hypothetical protein
MSFQNLVRLSKIKIFSLPDYDHVNCQKNEQKMINNVIQHDFTTVLQWIASENYIDDQNLLLATVRTLVRSVINSNNLIGAPSYFAGSANLTTSPQFTSITFHERLNNPGRSSPIRMR